MENLRNQRCERFNAVRFGNKHYHSNGQCLDVLLKLNVLVRREHDIEGASSLLQKDSVREAPPTDLGNGSGFVAYE